MQQRVACLRVASQIASVVPTLEVYRTAVLCSSKMRFPSFSHVTASKTYFCNYFALQP